MSRFLLTSGQLGKISKAFVHLCSYILHSSPPCQGYLRYPAAGVDLASLLLLQWTGQKRFDKQILSFWNLFTICSISNFGLSSESTWCFTILHKSSWLNVQEYGSNLKVFKVEADPNQKLIEQYKVYGLPTLLLFKNGEEITRIEGAIPKKAVVDMLNKAGIEVAATA